MADASAVVAIRMLVMTTSRSINRSYSKTEWKDFTERHFVEAWIGKGRATMAIIARLTLGTDNRERH
jgi:hypothetical protein